MIELAIAVVAFVAGLTVFVFLNTAMERRGQYRPHFRRWDSSTSKLGRLEKQPSADELAAMMQQLERLETVRRSPLERVIGVGATHSEGDVTVELLSIELRGGGGRATYRTHAKSDFRANRDPRTGWSVPPRPTVVDDLGTDYATSMSTWGGSAGNDEYAESAADFIFAPAPPPAARSLRVSVPYLDPTTGQASHDRAPWAFDIRL